MKKIIIITTIFITVLLNISIMYAQVPRSEKDIPVFSGAVRDKTAETEQREEMGWEDNQLIRNATLKLFNTSASAEEVFDFYRRKLSGREGSSDEDPMSIQQGSTSNVLYETEFYTDEDFEDYMIESDVKHDGTWIKQSLKKNRKSISPDKWIKEARFFWWVKEKNNDLSTFYVIIFDNSFDSDSRKYATSTQIQFQVTTEKSDVAMRMETEEEMDMAVEDLARSLANNPPTEKDLGVPIYPGAKLDVNSTAGMSAGNDHIIYVYLSTDATSKIKAFYEQKTRIKPVAIGDDQYMIPLKGNMPIPDEGISIQPNIMFGGNAKSVISIQKIVARQQMEY